MITVIIPNKGREKVIPGLIRNLNLYYTRDEIEIKVITQLNDGLVRKCDLINVGVLESNNDIVMMDVDIRLLYKIRFQDLLDKFQWHILPFNFLIQMEEDEEGLIPISLAMECPCGYGGVNILKRDELIKCGAFPTEFRGWGVEDNFFGYRARFIRLNGILGHIHHYHQRKDDQYEINRSLLTHKELDNKKNGIVSTKYDIIETINSNGYIELKVNLHD
jgi:hypothetical protein